MRMMISGENRLGSCEVKLLDHVTRRLSFPFPLKISEALCTNGAERVSQCVNRGFILLVTGCSRYQLRKFLRIYCGCVQGSCAFLRNSEQSYRSLKLQEGLADCIANEDGERQIASAISFHGEETVCALLSLQILDLTNDMGYSILGPAQSINW